MTMTKKIHLTTLCLSCSFILCLNTGPLWASSPLFEPLWNALLKKNVSYQSKNLIRTSVVNYESLKESQSFSSIVRSLELVQLSSLEPGDETKAFWINVYNIAVVKLIIEAYPVQSVKDIGNAIQPVWTMDAIIVDHTPYSLDMIAKEILDKYKDPRLHFALANGSISGPDLRPEAYTKNTLNAQLDNQVNDFLKNETKGVKIDNTTNVMSCSKLFHWFHEDFESDGKTRAFIVAHTSFKIPDNYRTKHLFFDWSLNTSI